MTRDEIIAMAKEAGLLPDNSHPAPETRAMRQRTNAVQRFAALVAAKERESVAQLIETTEWWKAPKWQSALCPITKGAIAAAIRARGTKEGV